MAERVPVYLLAERLAGDSAWREHAHAIRDGHRPVSTAARYYGRNRADARALFATWLEACAAEASFDTFYMAMANLSEIMVWDAVEPPAAGHRCYWPDPRSYASWDRGAKALAARGGPSCGRCTKSLRTRWIMDASSGRRRWQDYCVVCSSNDAAHRDADLGDERRADADAANSLLDAVCRVVA